MEKVIWVIIILVAYFIGNLSPVFTFKKVVGDAEVDKADMRRLNAIGAVVGVAKGFVASFIGLKYGLIVGLCSVGAVILGDIFPVLYKFKGGKGVATALGAAIAVLIVIF